MTLEIFGVHGIQTPASAPYDRDWEKLLAAGGVACHVTAGRWQATTRIMDDVANVLGNKAFRARAIKDIAKALKAWLAATAGKKRVIVAHSMGQPLMLAACRAVAAKKTRVDVDAVTMGGPLENPQWQPIFAVDGLLNPPPCPTTWHFWNKDDPICASAGGTIVDVPWLDSIRIAVAGSPTIWNPFEEHDSALYLGHPLIQAMIARYQ